MIQYIIERVGRVFSRDSIVLATSDLPSDDSLEVFAKEQRIKCFRGSLEDVATRFYNAARNERWDYAVRINGDNIFVDVHLLGAMKAIAIEGDYDFISNVKERSFPKGMSIEIVDLEFYKSVLPEIQKDKRYFEHVTSFLYEFDGKGKHYYVMNTEIPELAGIQLAMDTKEDFERAELIIANFVESHEEYNLKELSKILLDYKNEK